MGTLDPEIEAFETEIIESWLQELPHAQRLLGLDLENTEEGKALVDKGVAQGHIAGKLIEVGRTDREIADITKLPLESIAVLRQMIESGD